MDNFPNGLASFGLPLVPSAPGMFPVRGWCGGEVWWVDSSTSTTGTGDGSFDAPFATLRQALTLLGSRSRANRGDLIICKPGHSENISSADYFSGTGSASGFSIIGLGSVAQRPTLIWTAATATWLWDTAGIELANFNLYLAGASATGALTVAAPITISAANCRIVNCYIHWGWDADSIVGTGIITTASCTDFEFLGNTCLAATAAVPTATFMTLVGTDRVKIIGNYIKGPTSGTTVGVIRGLTTASVDMFVAWNFLHNIRASSTIAFSPLTGSTGDYAYNMFAVESGILPITASIGRWHENYCVDTEGQAGALVGTPSS